MTRSSWGGTFTTGETPVQTNAARFNANGSLDASFDPQPDAQVTAFLPVPGGKVYIGGAFKKVRGTARTCLALVNSDGSLDHSFNPNWGVVIPGSVQGIAVQSDGKGQGGRQGVDKGSDHIFNRFDKGSDKGSDHIFNRFSYAKPPLVRTKGHKFHHGTA